MLLALAVPAFWPDYLARPAAADAYTHAHALLGLAWLALIVVQPLLVRAGRVALHRRLGRCGVAVGAAFVVVGVLLTHHRASRMSADAFAREGFHFYLPLAMAVIFAAALALAWRWRRWPALHARYMAATMLPLIDPVTARLLHFYAPPLPGHFAYQLPAFTIVTVTLLALLRSLPARAPGRGEFGAFTAATVAVLALYFATPYSATWLQWLQGFRSVPLT